MCPSPNRLHSHPRAMALRVPSCCNCQRCVACCRGQGLLQSLEGIQQGQRTDLPAQIGFLNSSSLSGFPWTAFLYLPWSYGCCSHLSSLLLCLGSSSEDSFSAIKLTALGRPQFLVSDFWCQGSHDGRGRGREEGCSG